MKWNPSLNDACLLCYSFAQSRNHLFADCGISAKVWRQYMVDVKFLELCKAGILIYSGLAHLGRGKLSRTVIFKLARCATICYISVCKETGKGRFNCF